ncbi:DUF2796 domain-containing protein [Thauera sp.]|jgi:hypothetical protein|uniref:DUF2796 domain-containing protein n=1 Tax=Thauera sp. TaxID=1905334 RepID=UPI002639B841|nr:DUF2796 domain-containing protein [Thauera sp.]MCK6408644.1 DUF2796 domain-containing protein [Thauera sp.]
MHANLRLPLILLAFFIALGLSSGVCAQAAHGAHEHGVAELAVVLEGPELVVELSSPLDNLVGFEHAPANDVQRAALVEAGRRLRDAGAMFVLPAAAGCRLGDTDIESPWPLGTAATASRPTPAPASAHAGHTHAPPVGGDHGDVVATWRFTCAQPQALERLEVGAFRQFPRLRKLRVEHVTARGQGAAVLTPRAFAFAL